MVLFPNCNALDQSESRFFFSNIELFSYEWEKITVMLPLQYARWSKYIYGYNVGGTEVFHTHKKMTQILYFAIKQKNGDLFEMETYKKMIKWFILFVTE